MPDGIIMQKKAYKKDKRYETYIHETNCVDCGQVIKQFEYSASNFKFNGRMNRCATCTCSMWLKWSRHLVKRKVSRVDWLDYLPRVTHVDSETKRAVN